MSAKFTPGPWQVISGHKGFIINSDGFYDLAVVRNIGNQNNEANARLIAASPDGYALAEAVAEHFKDTDAPLGAMARAFLAKARGEA